MSTIAMKIVDITLYRCVLSCKAGSMFRCPTISNDEQNQLHSIDTGNIIRNYFEHVLEIWNSIRILLVKN